MATRYKRIRNSGFRVVLALGLVALLLVVVLTRTPFGKEWVLRELLAQVGSGIQGQIEVKGISSPGLLRGITFREVSIKGRDGRSFLQADSVRAGVSGPALLRGDLVLTGVRVWRPRVVLERLPDQAQMNAVAIFLGLPATDSLETTVDSLPVDEEAQASGPRRSVVLQGAEIHGGTLDIFLPLSPGRRGSENILVQRAPDGTSLLRRMTFRDIDLELGQATLRMPGQRGERFELKHLSLIGEVWPEDFQVTGAQGDIRREGARLVADFRSLSMPESRVSGQADVRWGGGQGIRLTVQGEAEPLALEDLFFIEDRLPSGLAAGAFGLDLSDEGFALSFQDTELTSEMGGVKARGSLTFGDGIEFGDLALDMTGLDLAVTDPWVTDTLPLKGFMDGALVLAGNLDELELMGRVELTDPDSVKSMSALVDGRIGLRDGFSASSLDLTIAPLDWGALGSLSPAMTLKGSGAIRMVLTGSLWGDGLGVDGELTHVPLAGGVNRLSGPGPGGQDVIEGVGGASRVTLGGSIRRDSARVYMNLTGDLSPLSLTSLRRSFPALPLDGEYSGVVEVTGPLSALQVVADVETSGGPLHLNSRFDTRRIASSYVLEVQAREEVLLSALVPSLPDPTRLRGHLSAVGRGLTLDALGGRASLVIEAGIVGPIQVDSASVELSIEEGLLDLRQLFAETNVGRLVGDGSFGVASSSPPGELSLGISSESLEGLRPFFMDEVGLILDDLSNLEKTLLELEGVNLDTLPTSAEVAVGGVLEGRAVIRGGVSAFQGEGSGEFQDLRLRTDYVQAGEIAFSFSDFPGEDRSVRAQVSTDSLSIRSQGFRRGTGELEVGISQGRLRATATRSPQEAYSARGTYALDSLGGGVVNLDEFSVDFDSLRWSLGGPASFSWSEEGYRVRDLRLVRPGTEGLRLRADGFLPTQAGGETDFQLEVGHLQLTRVAQAVQLATPLEGILNIQGHMTGPPDDPTISGSLSGEGLRYGDFSLERVASTFAYHGERVDLDLEASDAGSQVLGAEGFFPADLRVRPNGRRMIDAPIDLRVSFDSFPAGIGLAFMDAIEEVEGVLSGDIRFEGTTGEVEPSGNLFLAGGAVSIPALGVRHRNVQARLGLTPDGMIQVDGSLQSGGTATVSGTVRLRDPLSDPELNLTVEGQDFLAVARRDVQGTVSGSVDVTRRYKSPRVDGALTVEEGVLMVEEVARSVEVLDLSDPAFFNVVDTALVTLQPIIRSSQNPFLQNLMLSVDLTMAQDSWLRGREMNLELAGNLGVYWDRTQRDLAFLGVLDAVRGVYSVFGRQFQVEEGTVSFPGTPGINPDLNIRALNRLRTTDNDRLEIIATVDGSLLTPRVSLSSSAAFQIAESDLVSYLIFGRPSYALASGQSAVAMGAAGATTSLAVGLFSSELGAILTRGGLDYLAVSQGQYQDLGSSGLGLQGTVATTQVEVGQYLTDNIFAALLFRPLSNGTDRDQLAALRIETRLSDRWTLEGYWEDRFLRSGILGFETGGLKLNKIYGFFLYREWGY